MSEPKLASKGEESEQERGFLQRLIFCFSPLFSPLSHSPQSLSLALTTLHLFSLPFTSFLVLDFVDPPPYPLYYYFYFSDCTSLQSLPIPTPTSFLKSTAVVPDISTFYTYLPSYFRYIPYRSSSSLGTPLRLSSPFFISTPLHFLLYFLRRTGITFDSISSL